MTDTLYGADIFLNGDGDIKLTPQDEFKIIESTDNLRQAISNRLDTVLGEMVLYTNYGSELSNNIGAKSTAVTLATIRQSVRKTLLQEPRIKENGIKNINTFYPDINDRTKIEVSITVVPIGTQTELNLIYPIFLA